MIFYHLPELACYLNHRFILLMASLLLLSDVAYLTDLRLKAGNLLEKRIFQSLWNRRLLRENREFYDIAGTKAVPFIRNLRRETSHVHF